MKGLFIDTSNSGISGDMFLAALLDLVPNSKEILSELESLKDYLEGIAELKIELGKSDVNGIQVNKLNIKIKEDKSHRTPKVMISALDNFIKKHPKFKTCKSYTLNVFNTMVKAEAKVHGKRIEEVHFHELSSVDTLIDILGVSICLDFIGVLNGATCVYCSNLPLGGGTVKSAHGNLPVPAPATLKILEKSRILSIGGPIESELTTPTGAALLTNLNACSNDFMPKMNIKNASYSTGQKTFNNFLNTLRLIYGELEEIQSIDIYGQFKPYIEEVSVIETNIDDVSGEIIGNFINTINMEKLLDIQVIRTITKKNRPGYIIQLICDPKFTMDLINHVINELGTLGVRYSQTKRICIDRIFKSRNLEIQNTLYPIAFKIGFIKTKDDIKIVNIKPEYEDLKKVSKLTGITLREALLHCQPIIKELYNDKNL